MTTTSTMQKLADSRGANMVEYIIMVGIVALIAFGGFKYFGQKVDAKVEEQGKKVSQVNGELSN